MKKPVEVAELLTKLQYKNGGVFPKKIVLPRGTYDGDKVCGVSIEYSDDPAVGTIEFSPIKFVPIAQGAHAGDWGPKEAETPAWQEQQKSLRDDGAAKLLCEFLTG